jgi:sulfate transport system substrate-binding protein
VVYPSISVEAEAPVAVVDKVVDKKGTRKQAQGYLEFLYSPAGQEIVAQHFYRPRLDPAVFQSIRRAIQVDPPVYHRRGVRQPGPRRNRIHFADGGVFDQIMVNR